MQQTDKPNDKQQLQFLLNKQKQSFAQEPFPSKAVRIDRLKRALDALLQNESNIVEALTADYGHRSADQTFFVELMSTTKPLREAIAHVGKWMKPESRSVDLPFWLAGARAEIMHQPLGVVGCISPWNFPINLTFNPLACMLAAGNRVMIKPSEHTPATADNLTPLTLELGGKSPVVLGQTANLELAAARIAFGKVFNAGQVCLAPDILYVPENRLEETVSALKAHIAKMLPEENATRDYVSVINNTHAQRLRGYIDEAKADNTEVIGFDWLSPDSNDANKNIVPLTLIIKPADSLSVNREEIFGPVLIVHTYKAFDEVVEKINQNPSPLALYYFGKNRQEINTLMANTRSGGVTINDVIMHYTVGDLPFGGVGPSGMGAYHGVHGFKQFSHAKSIYRQSGLDVAKALRPPYGNMFKRVSRFLLSHG